MSGRDGFTKTVWRCEELDTEFLRVDRLARAAELPEASIVDSVLKIMPPDDQEPEELEQLTRQAYAMLPRIKITDLLIEVTNGPASLRTLLTCATERSSQTEAVLRCSGPKE